MVIYRPGVGRVYGAGSRRGHPFEVDSDHAPPHPGYNPETGRCREAEVVERTELPTGLVVESYGAYKRTDGPPPDWEDTSEPEAPRLIPAPTAGNWRKDFGLNRNG